MKYLLDLNKLVAGDIILEAGDTKLVSDLIKKITKSEYSHAMIYLDHTMIHAVKGGVFSKNPQRLLVSSANDLKVLRLKSLIPADRINKICDNARTKVGSLYSKREASGAVLFDKEKMAKTKKQFCSRLVAQCYQEEGIKLVENSDYCSPEDFNKSEKLTEVDGCVRIATEEDVSFSEQNDPNLLNQEETFKWLKQTRELYKKQKIDIQTIDDVSAELFKDRTADKRICKYIEATKYLHLFNADREINAYRYNFQLFEIVIQSNSDVQSVINFEIELNRREVDRFSKNLNISRENYRNSKLKYHKLHVKLYRNILSEVRDRLVVINESVSNSISFTAPCNLDYLIQELTELIR